MVRDKQRRYEGGDLIFQEGERSTKAFIVVSGRVELLKYNGDGAPVRLSILGRQFFLRDQLLH